ncbi:MAG: long-chain fatty acid--CoA ligase [Nannocystaceae bacterium]
MSLVGGDWLGRRERLSPSAIALHDGADGPALTYRQWNRQVNRSARLLAGLGLQRGDRLAVLAKNSIAYLDLFFACQKLGAILQALNWRLAHRELAAILEGGAPTIVAYDRDFAGAIAGLRAEGAAGLAGVAAYLAIDGAALSHPDDVPLARRDREDDAPPPAIEVTADDPWVLCYTGGTTGTPKGAVLTHGTITWNAIGTVASWGLRADDVAILNAPLFHTGGLNVFTAPLVFCGGASIVCREFDAGEVLELCDRRGVTLFFGVPTMFSALLQHPRIDAVDLSRLRILISGGAPCPLPIFEAFWARGAPFSSGYGLTEAGPNNFWLPPEEVKRRPGSVGAPLMHVDLRIVDEAGDEVAADTVGELWLRGPHVCAGYWGHPEASAAAIQGGWLHTGDLCRRDADGYVTIVGRRKDMFISGGENVYPAEVEGVLAGHPEVLEVAVIGVADPHWGEVGRAFVVARPGLDPAALLAWARERLARYKVPKAAVIVDALPRTGAGKIDKKRLAEGAT